MSDEATTEIPPNRCPTCGQHTGRKHWLRSYKVRCAWIASGFPIAAAILYATTGMLVPAVFVTAAMTPFLLLGGGETWHDSIKLKGDGAADA
jgi:hypothetical protein